MELFIHNNYVSDLSFPDNLRKNSLQQFYTVQNSNAWCILVFLISFDQNNIFALVVSQLAWAEFNSCYIKSQYHYTNNNVDNEQFCIFKKSYIKFDTSTCACIDYSFLCCCEVEIWATIILVVTSLIICPIP